MKCKILEETIHKTIPKCIDQLLDINLASTSCSQKKRNRSSTDNLITHQPKNRIRLNGSNEDCADGLNVEKRDKKEEDEDEDYDGDEEIDPDEENDEDEEDDFDDDDDEDGDDDEESEFVL